MSGRNGPRNYGFEMGILLMLLQGLLLRVLAGRQEMTVAALSGPSAIDEQTVEQMWINCGLDLVAIKEEILMSSSYLFNKRVVYSPEIGQKEELRAKGRLQEALNLLSPEVNLTLLSCLVNQNFPLDELGEDTLRSWFMSYLESLLPHARRRHLFVQSHDLDSGAAPQNQNSLDSGAVIIAIALTAIVTSVTVALFLLCFFKFQRRTHLPGHTLKDGKPLLSLGLSDLSSSSQKSTGTSSSLLAPPRPLKNDLSQTDVEVSSLDSFSRAGSSKALLTPSNQNVQISSLESSDETPGSEPSLVLPIPSSENSSNSSEMPVMNTSGAPSPPPPCQQPSPLAPPPPGPPPPPKGSSPRPPPLPKGSAPRPPNGKPNILKASSSSSKGQGEGSSDEGGAPKTKLKPFFWDKVQAKNNQSMVWDRLRAGSFQFNEEMIESLFGYTDNSSAGRKLLSEKDPSAQFVRILEAKKSQNLAISLKAMNAKPEEVCAALMEGNELPPELLHALLKMAPTTEEELKIRLYSEPSKLGPAELFIRNIVEVPFAYDRIEALLFMVCLQEEASSTSDSFSIIVEACKELRNSRLFFKLLEAVLKTGNRMNDGTYRGGAQAFKLDTLLKLADVKGADGKTTLLHFVVLEIIRAEGVRASRAQKQSDSSFSSMTTDELLDDIPTDPEENYRELGLKVVSGLSSELENVKKAAGMDADSLAHTVTSLSEKLEKTREFLRSKMENSEEESQFLHSLRAFVVHAEADVTSLVEAQRKMKLLVKETTDYFHGDSGKDEGLRMFGIVKEFLAMIDKFCKEVKVLPKPVSKNQRTRETQSPVMSPVSDRLPLSPARDSAMSPVADRPALSPARDPPPLSPARDPSKSPLFPAIEPPQLSPARDLPPLSPARDPRQLLLPVIKDRRVDFSDSSSSDEDD